MPTSEEYNTAWALLQYLRDSGVPDVFIHPALDGMKLGVAFAMHRPELAERLRRVFHPDDDTPLLDADILKPLVTALDAAMLPAVVDLSPEIEDALAAVLAKPMQSEDDNV